MSHISALPSEHCTKLGPLTAAAGGGRTPVTGRGPARSAASSSGPSSLICKALAAALTLPLQRSAGRCGRRSSLDAVSLDVRDGSDGPDTTARAARCARRRHGGGGPVQRPTGGGSCVQSDDPGAHVLGVAVSGHRLPAVSAAGPHFAPAATPATARRHRGAPLGSGGLTPDVDTGRAERHRLNASTTASASASAAVRSSDMSRSGPPHVAWRTMSVTGRAAR